MRQIEPDRIQPARRHNPERRLLLVRHYERPERDGLIIMPDYTREDTTGKLWELAQPVEELVYGPDGDGGLQDVPAGSILSIRLTAPGDPGAAHLGLQDPDGRDLFVLDPEKVYQVIPRTWEEEE